MSEFRGFPSRMRFTPVPNIVFSSLLSRIEDMAELKVLLYLFYLLYNKKGNQRFVTLNELAGQPGLMQSLKNASLDDLKTALEGLCRQEIVLQLQIEKEGAVRYLYFLNSEAGKLLISRISSGEIEIPGYEAVVPVMPVMENPSDIYSLYEQNIGILTPLIADELKEAGKNYPEKWIREAIAEAAAMNKRSWRYIARILEHWATEGKDDGTHRGNITQNADPDKYIRGRYGHMVQR